MPNIRRISLGLFLTLILFIHVHALSFNPVKVDRRRFVSQVTCVTSFSAFVSPTLSVSAATNQKIQILATPSGVKYAFIKKSTGGKPMIPQAGDFVAIEYTGYLSNGQVR